MGKFVEYMGGNIHYEDSGKGDTIVLVHGYLESERIWSDFSARLEKHYRVISVDLPGNGRSSIYRDEHTMCFLAGSVLSVLDRESVDKCFLVGHSLGGYMSLSFLENWPGRLSGYCLFHSHPFADTPEIKENRLREMEIVRQGRKEIIYPANVTRMFADVNIEKFRDQIERSKEIASGHEADGIISVLHGMMNRKARDQLMERSDIPMIVILGRWDNYISWETMREKIRLPERGKIVTLFKSGHMGFLEEEEASLRIIMSFMDEITNHN